MRRPLQIIEAQTFIQLAFLRSKSSPFLVGDVFFTASEACATGFRLSGGGAGVVTGAGAHGERLGTFHRHPDVAVSPLKRLPSLFTGLYTKTRVDNLNEVATSVAGVKVQVQICDEAGANCAPVAPDMGAGVYYDKRFQQLSSNVPKFLGADCDPDPNVITPCYIQLILSTMAAHSADFVIGDVGGGTHTLKVLWTFETLGAPGDAAACVGPGVLTVTQVKTFSTSSGIDITTQN